jgi:hypothetical protein
LWWILSIISAIFVPKIHIENKFSDAPIGHFEALSTENIDDPLIYYFHQLHAPMLLYTCSTAKRGAKLQMCVCTTYIEKSTYNFLHCISNSMINTHCLSWGYVMKRVTWGKNMKWRVRKGNYLDISRNGYFYTFLKYLFPKYYSLLVRHKHLINMMCVIPLWLRCNDCHILNSIGCICYFEAMFEPM